MKKGVKAGMDWRSCHPEKESSSFLIRSFYPKLEFLQSAGLLACILLFSLPIPIGTVTSGEQRFAMLTVAGTAPELHGVPF